MQNYSIRIEGLSEKTTTEALRNYLENTKRSNGGDVEDATILGETAFVRFADHEGNLPNFHRVVRNSILLLMWCTNDFADYFRNKNMIDNYNENILFGTWIYNK